MDNDKNPTVENVLVRELIAEKRSARRWKNIRFFGGLAAVVAIAVAIHPNKSESKATSAEPYAALIRLTGEIGPGKPFSAEKVNPVLDRAFADTKAKGVILLVNSPGGTPVQATLIHNRILALRKAHPDKHIVVVGEDTLASGAYLRSAAADKIYVSDGTVTGSIGVISSGFGFDKVLNRYGVDHRVFHAGEHKDRLDQFEPLNPDDSAKIHAMLDAIHGQFIDVVKKGRGDRLHGDDKELFSGDFWTGDEAVKLGLADGIGDVDSVAEAEFHVKRFKEYSAPTAFWEQAIKKVTASLALNIGEATSQSFTVESKL